MCWCPSWSNSLWQEWSCGLGHCPGGNATDPIWSVLVSSDGISSWTPLKPQYSNPNTNPLTVMRERERERETRKPRHTEDCYIDPKFHKYVLLPYSWPYVFIDERYSTRGGVCPLGVMVKRWTLTHWPISCDVLTPLLLQHFSSFLTDSLPSLNRLCHPKTQAQFMQDGRKAVRSIPYVSVASFFLRLKQNLIAYRSSKVSTRPDCIFELHQL